MEKKELVELNAQAREMMRTSDFEGIRTLAKDKGIIDSVIDDFILGKCLILDDSKNEDINAEDEPIVNVIVPFYKSVEEKLEQEQEELLKNVKEEKQKAFIKEQLKVIVNFILSDNDLKAKAFQNWKELQRCYKSMTDKAREYAISGVACIYGDVILGWIKEYYNTDDRKEVENERKKEAIARKKAEEAAKAKTEKKPRKPRKTKAEKEKEAKAKAEEKAKADSEVNTKQETNVEPEVKTEGKTETSKNETVNVESEEGQLGFELDPSLV